MIGNKKNRYIILLWMEILNIRYKALSGTIKQDTLSTHLL